MRRNSLLTLVLAGASVCFVYTMPAMAQAQQTPQSGGPPMTEQQPRTGAPNGTMGPAQNEQMQTQSATTQMPPKADDQKFVKEAALGGMTEVAVGKLAQEKASSDAVKQFGKYSVKDSIMKEQRLGHAATPDPE